jgi:site-specific recombinase XerD
MYEQFKNDLLMQLSTGSDFAEKDIRRILSAVELVASDYEFKRRETSLVVYENELPKLAKMYIVCKKVEGFSAGTIYNYTKYLTNFFCTVMKMPEQVTANDVRVYLYQYQKERNVSDRSLDKVRSCLAAFYKWMCEEEYIDRNPMLAVKCIRYEKKPRKPCSQTDLEYLRMACETPKQRAILEVLYSTGCRVGELVGLKKSDIDWQERTVHLFGKGKKHRTSFLNAKAEVALREYLETRTDDNEYLFVSDRAPHLQMHNSGIQKIMREMAERAGGKVNVKVTPHVLRHTTATRMLENKADITSIQAILGHSNINTTMIYAHDTLENVKMEHRKAVV